MMRNLGRFRLAAASVLTGITFVATAVFATTGLAHNPSAAEYQYNPSAAQYRVTICHHTRSKKHPMHTITVSVRAWLHGHKRHGDTLGACQPPTPTTGAPTIATDTTRPGHGRDSGRGESGAQHGRGKDK